MSNSPLVVYTEISPNQGGQRGHEITRITPHCVVGQCTLPALGNWFSRRTTGASSNYGISRDGKVGMYVPESNRAWTSSSSYNDDRAVTIECASDTYEPYAFTAACYQTLIDLCADICRRNGKKKLLWLGDKAAREAYKPADDEMLITVHRWYATDGRTCPGTWLHTRLPELAAKVTAILNDNPEEEDDMTQTQFHAMLANEQPAIVDMFQAAMQAWASNLADNDSSPWSEAAREWATSEGIVQGIGTDTEGKPNYAWESNVTREQLITILYRITHKQPSTADDTRHYL